MKEKLWLLQKYDNGDFFIYGWTTLTAAKGYKVLTQEQADPYIKLLVKGKGNAKYLDNTELFDDATETNQESGWTRDEKLRKKLLENAGLDEADDSETQEIVDDVASKGVKRGNDLDEVRDINVSQEDIQALEMKHIKSLQHKTSLENHMLTKYQCEIPMGRLSTMKAMANSMITELAKDNRLYFVDGGVVIK